MAQRLAQGTHNPWVAGSNPAGPTRASAGRGQCVPSARFLSRPRLSAQAPRIHRVLLRTSAFHRVRGICDFDLQIGVDLARNSYSASAPALRGCTTARSHAKGPPRACPVSLLAGSGWLRDGARASDHQAFCGSGPAVVGRERPVPTQTSRIVTQAGPHGATGRRRRLRPVRRRLALRKRHPSPRHPHVPSRRRTVQWGQQREV